MINLTKKELKKIREEISSKDIIRKINKYLNEPEISHTYTQFMYPNNKFSKKFKTPDEAYDFVKNIIGEWSMKTADKWSQFVFIDMEDGKEVGVYSY